MTTNVEEQLSSIRDRISEAQTRKTRAELIREQAEQRITRGQETLLTTYKCETVEEARQLLTKLETNMAAKIADAEKALAESADD